ncbi:MAG TPA: hypothetical protein VFQ53_26940 [Kofleriaceae bacterium]|nr:hypothetical protein [Kofleriaceae bacterium]
MHPRVVRREGFPCVVAITALAACGEPPPPVDPAPPAWVYPPAPAGSPLGALKGRFGRSQPPQPTVPAGIVGSVRVPLHLATPYAVPGDGPARAVIYGLEGARSAIELVDVDRGQVMWRDTTACAGPVMGVTASAIVCADTNGVRAVGLDGKPRWKRDGAAFVALTDDRVVISDAGAPLVLDADDGEELTKLKLPPQVQVDTILASCGDTGRELFALGPDGKLVRLADVRGGTAVTWAVPVSAVSELDACTGDTIVVASPSSNGHALTAIARATGKITGRVDGVRGHWRARDGANRIEIATATGVASWPRELVGPPVLLPLPPLGELLDARGERRLVRATPLTAVVLDREGVAAYVAFGSMGAVLGDASVLGSSWTGSPAESVHRFGLPARLPRTLRVPSRRAGVAVPAELRDLPAIAPLDAAAAIAKPDTGKHAVTSVAIDPREPHVVYAVALEANPEPTTLAALAAVDLSRRAWRWQRADGCGPGAPLGIALARDVIACAARGTTSSVRATSRDGAAGWEWETDNLDAIQAAGSIVLAASGDRTTVLDAATGRVRGVLASDDGTAVRATIVAIDDVTWLVTYEHGRLVARLPDAAMLPVWSLAIDGVASAIVPSDRGVLVALDDGDAFRIALPSGEVTALPGLGLTWRATSELVTGETAGGPIPAPPAPPAPPPRPGVRFPYRRPPYLPPRPRVVPLPPGANPEAPTLWKPIPAPPPIGNAWQYTLYDLDGGLRARNDYALASPVPASARGPTGSPLVVTYGPNSREVIVLDPRTGDPLRRIALPDATPGLAFATIVDGTPVAGVVLAAPLRAVVF